MNYIYIYRGEFKKGPCGYELIRKAAENYCKENSLNYNPYDEDILLMPKGKPYFPNMPIEFSISHSGNLWICMISNIPCGIDVQMYKDIKWKEIAKRFFNDDEVEFVIKNGAKGFFKLWVRKEAYGKMTGEGFFDENMPSLIEEDGDFWSFRHIDLGEKKDCAFCTKNNIEYHLKDLF